MLKPSTRQLIESFGYRRQWLRQCHNDIGFVVTAMLDRRLALTANQHRQLEIDHSDFRQHLATLHGV